MKKLLILLFFIGVKLCAQNLVLNNSFENYSSCPTASGQLTLAVNWVNPSTGTPDYLNACSSSLGVPNAGLGFQYANSGNAMVGIWAFCDVFNDIREYVQSQLTMPLIANNIYLVDYYVNRANWSNSACNNISCLITNGSSFSSGANGLINANPQIVKFENPIIVDTLNWIKISSIYLASGGENFITIGNFKNDASTTYSNIPGNSSSCSAYYLLDDITIENITTPQWQYRDTTITLGDSVLIGPAITGLNVDWFTMSNAFINNAPGIYVKPGATSKYKATETFNSVVYNHTVTVTVLPPNVVNEYEALQNSVKIYPNPTNGNLTLALSKGERNVTVNKVVLRDVLGKEVLTGDYKEEMDISFLESGIYFLSLYSNNHLVVTKKVLKE